MEWDIVRVGFAIRREYGHPSMACEASRLPDHTAFANARRTHDTDDRPFTLDGLVHKASKGIHFPIASHERRLCAILPTVWHYSQQASPRHRRS